MPEVGSRTYAPRRLPRRNHYQEGPGLLTQTSLLGLTAAADSAPCARCSSGARHRVPTGSGSPPTTSGSGWTAARSPGLTGCVSWCEPGQVQPWTATQQPASVFGRVASRASSEV
jgi:hypothetical protein